ncbi:MAG: hypothetical protein A4E73_01340 [Syntrophaceae bacterium PtaU1.Bin231]|nr:MAG: hypothetical protein A4E73_01340 [Syntrophaceae bacterium PtaU1.Bin231]
MRRIEQHGLLAAGGQAELFVGVLDEKLREEVADGHFRGDGPAHALFRPQGGDGKGKGLRRRVVVQKMIQERQAGPADRSGQVSPRIHGLRQRQLQQVAHGHPEFRPVPVHAGKPVRVAPVPQGGILLVRQEIPLPDPPGERSEGVGGEADPAVFPQLIRPGIQVALQIRDHPLLRVPGGGPAQDVGEIVGGLDGQRQIHIVFLAGHGGLELRLASRRCIIAGEGKRLDVRAGDTGADAQHGRHACLRRDAVRFPVDLQNVAARAVLKTAHGSSCIGCANPTGKV